MDLKQIVLERFGGPQKCHGHCNQPASLKILREGEVLVVATVCAEGYVSRLIAYGLGNTGRELGSLVKNAVGPDGDFSDEDIRTATRYTWDMGMEDNGADVMFRVAYWTQNYRRTKSDAPNRLGLFACTKCGALFPRTMVSGKALCSSCS